MTVAGATALSVETSTNARVPESPAIAVSARVAIALLRTASTGLASISADVLVGGGVEDDVRPVLGEHLAHPLLVLAVGQDGGGASTWRSPTSSRSISNRFASLWSTQDEPARVHARDLAAQLGADRAAGAGDEHAAAGQVAADELDLHPHRVAAEHVLDAHLAQLARQAAAVLQQLEHGRHRAHRHAALAAGAARRARASRRRRTGSRSAPRRARRPRAPPAARRSCRAPRRRTRMPCLRGSSSTKPTGR